MAKSGNDVSKSLTELKEMKDQLSMMNSKLDGVTARLDDPDTGLKRLNDRMDAHTAAVIKLEQTVGGYGDMYKINDSNIRKMEKRLETVEEDAKIEAPPEYQLVDVS